MPNEKEPKFWERTSVPNLLRNAASGVYYARVSVNSKLKWKTLKTTVFSVAKLRLRDYENKVRAERLVERPDLMDAAEAAVGPFVKILRERTAQDVALAPATKARREIAIKALLKTWPDLPERKAVRVGGADAQRWAARALREGTGFVAPKAKTVRRGMSGSAFNKTVEVLSMIFAIAAEHGACHENPAAAVTRVPVKTKRLELPNAEQFRAVVKAVAEAGARQSRDCAWLVRLLACSGFRIAEAGVLRWRHVDFAGDKVTVPGTKTESSYRTVPLFPALRRVLEEIRELRGPEDPEAPVLHVKQCEGALSAACVAVGVKRMTHHDLRHLFATRCVESGVDIPTVSRWLGHADGGALAMRVYGHLRQEHSQAQAKRVMLE